MLTSVGSATTGAHAQHTEDANALGNAWDTVVQKASEFGSDAKRTFDKVIKQASDDQADGAKRIRSDLEKTFKAFARALADLSDSAAPNDLASKQKAAHSETENVLNMTSDDLKALGA